MKSIFQNVPSPLVCTPITGQDELAIFQQLEQMVEQQPDMIEWRADFFEGLADSTAVLEVLMEMKQQTNIPILFTVRAAHEGGESVSLSEQEIVLLLLAICEYSSVDMIDYEASNETEYVRKIREVSKENGKQLILSYHNFSSTPEEAELIEKTKLAASFEADVVKLAVMPEDKEDVFRLLQVTRKLDHMLDVPLVTMSMGELGALSRVIGWAYGSAMTFGVGAASSAPGQVPVSELRKAIETTKNLLPAWHNE